MGRRLRIGIDTLFENPRKPSGATGYLQTLLRWLPRVGPSHEFVAFVSHANAELYKGFEGLSFCWGGASNERLPLRILSQQTIEAFQVVRRRLDVINAPGNVGPLLAPVPLVLTIKTLHHYHTPEALGWARTLFRRSMVSASAMRARLVIANCEATKQEVARLVGVPLNRIRVVYEAVHESFAPAADPQAQRERVRERFKLGERYLLFVSSLWRYKNPDGLIRAYAGLPAEDRAAVLLAIVGQDYDGFGASLRQLAIELGVADRVRFVGPVPNRQLPDLYGAAEMFIYPSHRETFGLTLVEAMRSGTPVITSTDPALREVAADAAVFVTPTDTRALSDAIRSLLHDQGRRQDLRRRGLERGRQFTGERMAKETLAVYEEAVA